MSNSKKLEKLYSKEDWDGIIKIGSELFDDLEEDVHVLNDLSVAYNKKEMHEDAYKVCKRIYELNPKPDMAKQSIEIGVRYMRHHLVMGECYFYKKMFKEALEIFQKLNVIGKQFSERYIFAANIHLKEGHPNDAIAALREMMEQTRRKIDHVRAVLNEIIKKYPYNEKAYLFLHDILIIEQKLDSKILKLEDAVKNDNCEPSDIYTLINLLKCSGQTEKSSNFLKNILKKNQSDPCLLYFFACNCIETGSKQDGLKIFTNLLRKDKSYFPAVIEKVENAAGPNCEDKLLLKSLAGLYLASGEIRKGIDILEDLVELVPLEPVYKTKLTESLIKLINSLIKDKKNEEIGKTLERLAKLRSDRPEFAKKLEAFLKKDEERKIKEYEIQLEKGGFSEVEANQIRYKLADYYKKTGANESKRVSMFQQIAKSDSDFQPQALFNVGISFLSKGLDDLAYDNFSRIVTAKAPDKEKIDMFYQIGEAYLEKKVYDKANEFYKKILSIDMEYKDVAQKIEEVAKKIGTAPSSKKASRSLEDSYDDIKKIGEGGMGAIYRATHKVLGRTVALKVIRSEFTADAEALQRFIREAQSASALQHAGITTIYDINVEEPVYIAMELVEGGNLLQKLKGKQMDIKEFLETALDICAALNAAHEKGIVHRDIKLENIMLTKDGKIKIADFGLASITTSPRMTQSGQVMGTPLYMPPEQIKGLPTDNRSDIYALGITFYEMLTGNVPFKEGDIGYQHIHEPPEAPSFVNPSITEELEAAILKCIEKKPEDRYQKVSEIAEDLKKIDN